MTEETASDVRTLLDPEGSRDDVRRLGLVAATALGALAVMALAWASTPATLSGTVTAALGAGAVSVVALAGLGGVAAYGRVHEQLRAHATALDGATAGTGETAPAQDTGAYDALAERLGTLEAKVDTIQETQTEQLVDLIESTDPPATGASATQKS